MFSLLKKKGQQMVPKRLQKPLCIQTMLLNRGCANDELFLSHRQSFSGYFNLYYKPVPCSESKHHCILGKTRAITSAFVLWAIFWGQEVTFPREHLKEVGGGLI